MSSYPAQAYLVCAATAMVASAAELGTTYRLSPFSDKRFGFCWFCVIILDGLSGTAALAIIQAFGWPKHDAWLTGILGWVVVGLVATLIVRADLLELPVGGLSVPVGFGLVYGTLRSLLTPSLAERQWEINDAERDGRLRWSLHAVDNKGANLKLTDVEEKLRAYISGVIIPRNPSIGIEALRRSNEAIDNAKRNLSAGEVEVIKQLVTFMINEDHISPLSNLLGRPSKKEIRKWRNGANLTP